MPEIEFTPEDFEKLTDKEKEIFTHGRVSVLRDFHNVCSADAFLGFSEEEFTAVKKFIAFNETITGLIFN